MSLRADITSWDSAVASGGVVSGSLFQKLLGQELALGQNSHVPRLEAQNYIEVGVRGYQGINFFNS
jgi:hypothetical protein